MKPYLRQGNSIQNIHLHSPESQPTLHDSKSAVYLNPNLDESKKFRETTYYPTSGKNTNFEFLRYTVNIKKSQREKSANQIITPSQFKFPRKMTE